MMTTATKSTTAPPVMKLRRLLNARLVQNFHLVWLDENIDDTNDDCLNSIAKLQEVINTVNTFNDVDECIDFVTEMKGKAFMIISAELSQTVISLVHDISHINCIYILCQNDLSYEAQSKECSHVKGIFRDILSICQVLKSDAQNYERNSIPISLVQTMDEISKQNLDQLDPSFMYTHILKEILLTIDFEQVHFKEFIEHCRNQLIGNNAELKNIDLIEKEYAHHPPIWWYTYQSIFYSILNRALRTMEFDHIVKMAFFVRDLHNHITAMHAEQYDGKTHSTSFTVYRGQGLSRTHFDQMRKTQGGLLSFNNFLSTSLDRAMSFVYAESNRTNPDDLDMIGVLFEITINPSIHSTPFANIQSVSYYPEEKEILFSMHSVFRIAQVKQIQNDDRLWQVDLILTSDNDP